jgi:ubiquinone/menaquinone biosynthesis C-methylase UbiE
MVRAMRVVDLDRDMSDVIPTGMSRDSEYLFEQMTLGTIDAAIPTPGRKVLDVASGVGQDTIAIAMRGAQGFGAEPSRRMIGMARMFAEDKKVEMPSWVQCWADNLPFATGAFDSCICKGALDHFDRPEEAIAEMARVTAVDGQVVLAVANFESLSCRVGRAVDDFREDVLKIPVIRDRRGYDAPSDHFTRYEVDLIREQASRHLIIDEFRGVSCAWGLPGWAGLLERLPSGIASVCVQALDRLARVAPVLADVIILTGRPRRAASTSA